MSVIPRRPIHQKPPIPSSPSVSRRMSRVRSTSTGPEIRLRRNLHARGLRYRVNRQAAVQVRCRADIVFRPARVAVFVDGCFWHGCPDHGSWPKSNASWWRTKIKRNRTRDLAIASALTDRGWLVLRIWEHEDPEEAAGRIEAIVRMRNPGHSSRTGTLTRRSATTG